MINVTMMEGMIVFWLQDIINNVLICHIYMRASLRRYYPVQVVRVRTKGFSLSKSSPSVYFVCSLILYLLLRKMSSRSFF